jgi:putative sterol carrier protein
MTKTSVEHVDMGLPASFVWDYDARRPRLAKLYEKSKVSQWNAATDVDWSVEIDPGAMPVVAQFEDVSWGEDMGPITSVLGNDPEVVHEIVAQNHGWLISQFMHGEQGALVATAKICAAAESIDDKYYAAAQVADEARHVEAYQRYLDKIGITYPVTPSLSTLLNQVMGHRHVDMTFLGMQILVEGVALAAFSLGDAMLANPLISRITSLVRADEARHVAFGVLSLQGTYDDMDPIDLREREDFVLEACALMRDRFEPIQVWEHFGIDVAEARARFADSPDMAAFRSLLFSKVVPNLRKLGLLTPRVREGFEQLGILRYERFIDSATEAGELDPNEDVDTSDPMAVLRASLAGVEKVEPGPVLQVLASMATPEAVREAGDAVLRLHVTGADEPDWLVTIRDGAVDVAVTEGEPEADATVLTDTETWAGIVTGRVTAPGAFIDGKLTVTGDVTKALALEALL